MFQCSWISTKKIASHYVFLTFVIWHREMKKETLNNILRGGVGSFRGRPSPITVNSLATDLSLSLFPIHSHCSPSCRVLRGTGHISAIRDSVELLWYKQHENVIWGIDSDLSTNYFLQYETLKSIVLAYIVIGCQHNWCLIFSGMMPTSLIIFLPNWVKWIDLLSSVLEIMIWTSFFKNKYLTWKSIMTILLFVVLLESTVREHLFKRKIIRYF